MATVLIEAYPYMQLSWILTITCGHVKGYKWDLVEGHTCMYNESEFVVFFLHKFLILLASHLYIESSKPVGHFSNLLARSIHGCCQVFMICKAKLHAIMSLIGLGLPFQDPDIL